MTAKQRIGNWLIPNLPINRFTFDLLRIELNLFKVETAWKLSPNKRRLRQLKTLRDLYVNVAFGRISIGWLRSPGSVWRKSGSDPVGPQPQPALCGWSVQRNPRGAFSGTHRGEQDLRMFLGHCYRTLKNGGVLRIVVPDAEKFLQAYCRPGFEGFAELGMSDFPADLPTRMDYVNHMFHQWHEHRWGYDFENLSDRLRKAGFSRVCKQAYRQSLDPFLAQDRAQHEPYSLYVNAVK